MSSKFKVKIPAPAKPIKLRIRGNGTGSGSGGGGIPGSDRLRANDRFVERSGDDLVWENVLGERFVLKKDGDGYARHYVSSTTTRSRPRRWNRSPSPARSNTELTGKKRARVRRRHREHRREYSAPPRPSGLEPIPATFGLPLRSRRPSSSPPPPEMKTKLGKFELQRHQVDAVRSFAKSRDGLLMYYKVGTGKTLAAIAAVEHEMRRDRRVSGVVVITPASLIDNFKKELRGTGVDSRKYKLYSFEAVHAMPEVERAFLGENRLVIVDEAHTLRNPESLRLRSALEVTKRAAKVLLLTGTPVMNYPADVGALIGLMSEAEVETCVGAWGREELDQDPGKWYASFQRNFGLFAHPRTEVLDKLRCRSLFYEPPVDVVKKHYPTKAEHWIPVELSELQTKHQMSLGAKEPSLFPDLKSMLKAFELGKFNFAWLTLPRTSNASFRGHNPKADEIVRRVTESVRAGKKCIVHSSYLETSLYIVRDQLLARGVACAAYEGKLSREEKRGLVKKYNDGHVSVLLLSDAGKEGLDLKNTAEVHIAEPSWNEEKIQQIIGRAVRYESHAGPNKHVDVFRYYATMPTDRTPSLWDDALRGWWIQRQEIEIELRGLKNYDYDPATLTYSALPPEFTWKTAIATDLSEGGRFPGPKLQLLAADEILKILSEHKWKWNSDFLADLVRKSDENLKTC